MAFLATLSRWLKRHKQDSFPLLPTLESMAEGVAIVPLAQFRIGESCMLTVMERHFLVRVLRVDEKTIQVSFPGIDYPISGMMTDLEFHDPEGFRKYESKVVRGPQQEGDGVILERPLEKESSRHRDAFRIDTELRGRVGDVSTDETFEMTVHNISTIGALLESPAQFAMGSTLRLHLDLPGFDLHEMEVEIMHAATVSTHGKPLYQYGVQFVGHQLGAGRSLTEYIWRRLRQIYPSD